MYKYKATLLRLDHKQFGFCNRTGKCSRALAEKSFAWILCPK